MLEFNKRYTYHQVFINLVEDTLLRFEKHFPLKLTLKLPKVACSVDSNEGDNWTNLYYKSGSDTVIKFYENYEAVFYNLLDESDLALIPLEVKRLQMGFTTDHPSGYRIFKYNRPYLVGNALLSFNYYSGIFKYPILSDTRDTDVVTLDKSWILLMEEGTDTYRIFKAAMIVKICEYIKALKNNFQLPGIPIEVFGALDDIARPYSDLVQTEYSNSVNSDLWD